MRYLAIALFVALAAEVAGQSTAPDVAAFAKKEVDRYFLRGCIPGSTFLWTKTQGISSDIGYEIIEFRKFGYDVVDEPLSEADKLNGYEWRGKIVIRASFYREYLVSGPNRTLGSDIYDHWLEFKDFGKMSITDLLEKKDGKFRAIGLDAPALPGVGGGNVPDCKTIKGLPRR